jgi:hypothetical protein
MPQVRQESDGGHGLKSFFSTEGRAERKERKKKEQERIDKIVITSRHTATIKTRMLLEQHNLKPSSAPVAHVQGTVTSAHTTAAEQEARLPHSGPPALHGQQTGKRAMPMLTRIDSNDGRDEEDDRVRPSWNYMRRVSEAVSNNASDEEVAEAADHVDNDLLHVRGTSFVGASLEGDAYTPKPAKKRHSVSGGFHRNNDGVWTR